MMELSLHHQHEAINKTVVASKKTDNPYEEKNFAVRSRTAISHWLSATCSLSLTAMVRTRTKAGARYYENGVKDFLFIKDLRDEF